MTIQPGKIFFSETQIPSAVRFDGFKVSLSSNASLVIGGDLVITNGTLALSEGSNLTVSGCLKVSNDSVIQVNVTDSEGSSNGAPSSLKRIITNLQWSSLACPTVVSGVAIVGSKPSSCYKNVARDAYSSLSMNIPL